jgi:hypothetical protein
MTPINSRETRIKQIMETIDCRMAYLKSDINKLIKDWLKLKKEVEEGKDEE